MTKVTEDSARSALPQPEVVSQEQLHALAGKAHVMQHASERPAGGTTGRRNKKLPVAVQDRLYMFPFQAEHQGPTSEDCLSTL